LWLRVGSFAKKRFFILSNALTNSHKTVCGYTPAIAPNLVFIIEYRLLGAGILVVIKNKL